MAVEGSDEMMATGNEVGTVKMWVVHPASEVSQNSNYVTKLDDCSVYYIDQTAKFGTFMHRKLIYNWGNR